MQHLTLRTAVAVLAALAIAACENGSPGSPTSPTASPAAGTTSAGAQTTLDAMKRGGREERPVHVVVQFLVARGSAPFSESDFDGLLEEDKLKGDGRVSINLSELGIDLDCTQPPAVTKDLDGLFQLVTQTNKRRGDITRLQIAYHGLQGSGEKLEYSLEFLDGKWDNDLHGSTATGQGLEIQPSPGGGGRKSQNDCPADTLPWFWSIEVS